MRDGCLNGASVWLPPALWPPRSCYRSRRPLRKRDNPRVPPKLGGSEDIAEAVSGPTAAGGSCEKRDRPNGSPVQSAHAGQRPNNPTAGQRPNTPNVVQRPNTPYTGQRPNVPNAGQQPNKPIIGQRPNLPNAGQRPNNPIVARPGAAAQRQFTRTAQGRRYDNGIQRKGNTVLAAWQRPFFPHGSFHYPYYSPTYSSTTVVISPYGFFFGVCAPFIQRSHCLNRAPIGIYIDIPLYSGADCRGYVSISASDNYLDRDRLWGARTGYRRCSRTS